MKTILQRVLSRYNLTEEESLLIANIILEGGELDTPIEPDPLYMRFYIFVPKDVSAKIDVDFRTQYQELPDNVVKKIQSQLSTEGLELKDITYICKCPVHGDIEGSAERPVPKEVIQSYTNSISVCKKVSKILPRIRLEYRTLLTTLPEKLVVIQKEDGQYYRGEGDWTYDLDRAYKYTHDGTDDIYGSNRPHAQVYHDWGRGRKLKDVSIIKVVFGDRTYWLPEEDFQTNP